MRKSRALIQLFLALLLAGGAGFLVLSMSASKPKEAEQPPPRIETTDVAVASTILKAGEKIDAESVRMVPYLEESMPDGCFTDLAELEGRVVLTPMGKGEPVTRGKLVDKDSAVGGVSALIGDGKRAMAVKGNKVMGLAGFVRPGNKVDVLVTLEDGRRKSRTKVVLENVPVLATGEKLEALEDGTQAPVDVYTLEVAPEESERLALAATKGTLHFALRGMSDNATILTHGVDVDRALAAYKPKPPPRPRRHPPHRVEIITGAERTAKKF
ncbi:Flp pilus assembly protein CpaB [Desulfohalovibrio reitneri]|uniref:Flp pilus assembly protein CpaB n=1 Tax=Desulfohalovibrio reitneri TaxID=1307759 RepID=UPI0004A6B58B|nr:Flp pilus assembly protein CpaB [Desulfohalovibrio reitneri]